MGNEPGRDAAIARYTERPCLRAVAALNDVVLILMALILSLESNCLVSFPKTVSR